MVQEGYGRVKKGFGSVKKAGRVKEIVIRHNEI
jgi:hypothetical protein